MKISTVLLSGAGNTFHLIGADYRHLPAADKKKLAQVICSKNQADGLIFLRKSFADENYEWDFYNNDGSDAEMCGNATRCVGHFIKNELKDSAIAWWLQTKAGRILIKARTDSNYEITMTPLVSLTSRHGFYCNTGVPHLVLPIDNFDDFQSLKQEARALRNHSDFAPAGTNVTYVKSLDTVKNLKAVTYERGVEDFTQACGTGAVAAAFYNLKLNAVAESSVEMPGGSLIMNLHNLEKPLMTGPAKQVGKFEYDVTV